LKTPQTNTWRWKSPVSGSLVALFAAASMIWVFIELADAVSEKETHQFDTYVILMLRNSANLSDPIGPIWIEELGRDITALGSVGVLTLLVLATSGFLWLSKQPRLTLFLLASVSTGVVLSQMLKLGFDRPRPELVSQEAFVYTSSFPSGHSLMAAIVYLTLGVLLARTLERRAAKGYIISLAIFVVIAVGVSRVYLGVHWPTDVLAEWIVGAAWALICGLLAEWLARSGKIDLEKTVEFGD